MSNPTTAPHISFAIVWSFWWITVIWALPVAFTNPLVGFSLIGAFGIYEYLALRSGRWRNTLSACVTWTVRRLSKHEIPFRGWNCIVPLVILPIVSLIFISFYAYVGGYIGAAIGAAAAGITAVGLHDHWLSPSTHG